MRVVILHESPGADTQAQSFVQAAEAFNRGLDIRLRFLDVGFELRSVPVSASDDDAPSTAIEQIRAFAPGMVLALGDGDRLLECVAAAVKDEAPIAFLASGPPSSETRAIAQLADVFVACREEDSSMARRGAKTHLIPGRESAGPALVEILVRTVKGPVRK